MATTTDTITALDLIKGALRLIQVLASGETPTAQEATDSRIALNQMLDSWNNDSKRVFYLFNEDQTISSGTGSYTIGDGATWDTDRPVRLETVFVRDSNNYDYPVAIINNEEYFSITDKAVTSSFPDRVMYNPAYSNGTLYFWPIPNQSLTARLSSWKQFTGFSANTTTVSLPPGFQRALRYNLAIELAAEYGATVRPEVAKIAEDSLALIEDGAQRNYVMEVDNGLISGSSGYSIYSDSPKQ